MFQDGDTALHLAVRSGRRDVANALLMCGADLNVKNKVSSLDCHA